MDATARQKMKCNIEVKEEANSRKNKAETTKILNVTKLSEIISGNLKRPQKPKHCGKRSKGTYSYAVGFFLLMSSCRVDIRKA